MRYRALRAKPPPVSCAFPSTDSPPSTGTWAGELLSRTATEPRQTQGTPREKGFEPSTSTLAR